MPRMLSQNLFGSGAISLGLEGLREQASYVVAALVSVLLEPLRLQSPALPTLCL